MRDDDDERPRWHDADEDDERPDWEDVEDEQEPPEQGGVLGHTAPVARIVFTVVLIAILVVVLLSLKSGLARWFGG